MEGKRYREKYDQRKDIPREAVGHKKISFAHTRSYLISFAAEGTMMISAWRMQSIRRS
jgi:hypothetical protein